MRLERLRQLLDDKDLDALLVAQADNRYYLSGFTGSAGVLVIGRERAILATDFRYVEQAGAEAKGFDIRKKDDITFHSIRGGTIVSDHEILFIGDNEILKISHTAFSREIFADGVIKGIHFLFGKNNGFYTMEDVLKL